MKTPPKVNKKTKAKKKKNQMKGRGKKFKL